MAIRQSAVFQLVASDAADMEQQAPATAAPTPEDRTEAIKVVKADTTALGQENFKQWARDREFILEVTQDPSCFDAVQYSPDELKDDADFMLKLAELWGSVMAFASPKLKGDAGFMTKALCLDFWGVWRRCEQDCKLLFENDRDFMLFFAKRGECVWSDLGDKWSGDREIVEESLKTEPEMLGCASEELRGDRELVMKALWHPWGFVVKFASEALRGDREIGLQAVRATGDYKGSLAMGLCAMRYLSEELQNDREIAMEAVRQEGMSFLYCSDSLRGDEELFLEAIKTYPDAKRNMS